MLENEETLTVMPLSGVGRALAYKVDEQLAPKVSVGSLIRIPLGNRSELGVVVKKGDDGEFDRSDHSFHQGCRGREAAVH